MFIKSNCLMPVLAACFYCLKNASNAVKLLQKSGSGRPRLVAAYSFGGLLTCLLSAYKYIVLENQAKLKHISCVLATA